MATPGKFQSILGELLALDTTGPAWHQITTPGGFFAFDGTFGGAAIEIDISDSETNPPAAGSFSAMNDETGTTVSITVAQHDVNLPNIPPFSLVRMRVVGGDGTTSLNGRFNGFSND